MSHDPLDVIAVIIRPRHPVRVTQSRKTLLQKTGVQVVTLRRNGKTGDRDIVIFLLIATSGYTPFVHAIKKSAIRFRTAPTQEKMCAVIDIGRDSSL